MSDLKGAVTKVVLEIVKKVALDVDFVNVVDECGNVEGVICVLKVEENCCCVLAFGKAELNVCSESCEVVSGAASWEESGLVKG